MDFTITPGKVEVSLDDGWVAEYRLVVQGGVPTVRELRVRRHTGEPLPLGGLPARVVKRVKIGDAYDAIRLVAERALEGPIYNEDTGERLPRVAVAVLLGTPLEAALEGPRRPGRAGRPDRFYAEVARGYVRLLEAGSRAPIRDLARELEQTGEWYSSGSVSQLVHAARTRGLLTDAPKGRPGGRLTPKAKRLLTDETEGGTA